MEALWAAFNDGVDLVNGYKISRSDPLHRIIGRIYHHTVKILFGLKVRDVDCDFRLMRRAIFDRVVLEKNSGVILPRDDEEDPGRRLPDRRSARAPLPPRVRKVAVLQLPPPVQDRCRRDEALVRAGDSQGPSPDERCVVEQNGNVRTAPATNGRPGLTLDAPAPAGGGDYKAYYRGRRVMITGGVGFIGSNLARQLVDLGAEILLVDSLIPDYGGNLYNIQDIALRLRLNVADVRMQTTMEALVRNQDVIFNLAGQVSHIDSMRDPYTDLEINCRAQLSILEACRSTTATCEWSSPARDRLWRPDYLPVDEKHLVRPADINGVNKAAGVYHHLLYNNVFDVHACSLRLTNVYGRDS